MVLFELDKLHHVALNSSPADNRGAVAHNCTTSDDQGAVSLNSLLSAHQGAVARNCAPDSRHKVEAVLLGQARQLHTGQQDEADVVASHSMEKKYVKLLAAPCLPNTFLRIPDTQFDAGPAPVVPLA
jgi:hypothetical protein